MKKLILLFTVIFFSTILFGDLTIWPKNILAELFTSSQCNSCLDAYQGLEYIHSQYDYSEFNSIRYYTSEGGGLYGSETVDPVFDYYNVTFTPQVFFNGTDNVPGGGEDIANGSQYSQIINAHYFEASPIKMRILSFDSNSGNLSVGVTLMNDNMDLTDAVIRFALVENNVTDIHTRIVRYITKSNLNISNVGEEIIFNKTLEISSDYNQDNLYAVSFVQLPTHEIIQSVSTYSQPEIKVRIAVPFNPNTWDENYDPDDPYYMYEGDFFSVINTGSTEVTVNVDISYDTAPDGWDISFCDHTNCYMGTAIVTIPPNTNESYHDFHAVILPTSEGEATYHFTVTVEGTDISYTIPFYYSTSASSEENTISFNSIGSLKSAYPNPFSYSLNKENNIKIRFSIFKNLTSTTLSIYNFKGQKVKKLISDILKPGNYNINWNLTNENGEKVSSGIYFYILDVNGKKITKKLTVLK